MININCIAIDDEPLALDIIQNYASKVPFLDLKGTFQNPIDAIEHLDNNSIDLIFLDIQMPELTGFEFLKSLPKQPLIIFTTAYPNFALESYENDAVDYLVKPIAFDRFLKAVSKVKQRLSLIENTSADKTEQPDKDFIFVKTEYKTVKIDLKEILFVESQKDYVIFTLEDNSTIPSLLSIRNVNETLPSNNFIRVHRSFILAIDKIDSIERNTVIINEQRIPVGESYRDQFKTIISQNKLQ